MEMKFCQSCGMPLTDDYKGTNADGSRNEDYCNYCYMDGRFMQDMTMEQMIEHCCNKQILNRHFSVKLNHRLIIETISLYY